MYPAFSNRFAFWRPRSKLQFAVLFKKFQSILERNIQILEQMADMGNKLGGEFVFDRHYIEQTVDELSDKVFKLISDFSLLNQRKNTELFVTCERIHQSIKAELDGRPLRQTICPPILPLSEIGLELIDEVGAKIANLGEIRNRFGMTTPDGFAITTSAFDEFMAATGISSKSVDAVRLWQQGNEEAFRRLADEVSLRILATPLPKDLASRIKASGRNLVKRSGAASLRFTVRSSAAGEDGTSSFAGQHETVLNVTERQIDEAYRRVVASTFSLSAWQYRLARGYQDIEATMAVGCQVMVDGKSSGVLQTQAPDRATNTLVIESLWGLCAPVVNGDCLTDSFTLDRMPPYRLVEEKVVRKPRMLITGPQKGTIWQDVPALHLESPSLNTDQLRELAETGMTLEVFFKRPLEIEWTFDHQGILHILQVRPLSKWTTLPVAAKTQEKMPPNAETIFFDRGAIVQCGDATGRVVFVDNDRDLENFPHGGILIARHASPRYSCVMQKARGIITDFGSSSGHMATIAREFRVPTIVNTEIATSLLHPGDLISLDATNNVVYRGDIGTFTFSEPIEEEIFEDSAEYRLLRRVMKHITPLNLVNPQNETFLPSACRTCHDITRYIHEKSVEELIRLSETRGASHASAPRKLKAELPLGLLVINAGDGLTDSAGDPEVTVEQIASIPLTALLAGLIDLGMWSTRPLPVNLNSFMASITRTFSTSLAGPKDIGRNLAVVMLNYMNINLRLGYHFTTIDAYIADTVNDNYIYFRFLGGVTELVRRSRRAACIARVLEHFDFRVETHGDLVMGRLKKQSAVRMCERLQMLGALIGYTRQLDAQMHSDSDVANHAEYFIKAIDGRTGGDVHDQPSRNEAAPPAHSR